MANELTDFMSRLSAVTRDGRILRTALTSVMAIHKPRIFERGLDREGSQIGKYGTNPLSISRKNQARNTGHTYFKGGYDQYKQEIGKNPGFVNLRNTDQMMQDYGITGGDNQFGFGFQNTENFNKSIWLQDKYDKQIFDPSDQELQLLAQVMETEIIKSL